MRGEAPLSLLSVDDACTHVRHEARPLHPRRVPLLNALGCRLAEPIAADRDSPPFAKSLVDGYAVQCADLRDASAPHTLRVIDQVFAGQSASVTLKPGEAATITTGAPIPPGADAVVMREVCERRGDHVLISLEKPSSAGANVLPQAKEMHAGETILEMGHPISPIDLGILAAVGAASPLVIPRPRIGILATGDEIVAWSQSPGAAQIRNSNSAHLHGLARVHDADPVDLGIAVDQPAALSDRLSRALHDEHLDILLISGGVSVGDRDLVPATLADLGVRPIFHKVSLKPGKPLFFGAFRTNDESQPTDRPPRNILVFGLPGNPVSTIVGFLLFVRPALEIMQGAPANETRLPTLPLAAPFAHRGARTTFHPCRLVDAGNERHIEPLKWFGSPDLRTISRADGFARLGPGDQTHQPGDLIEFLALRPNLDLALSVPRESAKNEPS